MPPEGHLRGAGPPTSCDAAVGLTASLGSAVSNQNDPNQTADSPTQGTTPAERTIFDFLLSTMSQPRQATSWVDLVARWTEGQQAATAVVAGWRGNDARWNDCRHLAATAIAAGWVVFITRRHVARYHEAATDIAAGWRGGVARRSVDCEQASATIARGWRRKQAQGDAAATLAMLSAALRRTRAATALVSHWRGHAARLWRGPVAETEGHATGAQPLDQAASSGGGDQLLASRLDEAALPGQADPNPASPPPAPCEQLDPASPPPQPGDPTSPPLEPACEAPDPASPPPEPCERPNPASPPPRPGDPTSPPPKPSEAPNPASPPPETCERSNPTSTPPKPSEALDPASPPPQLGDPTSPPPKPSEAPDPASPPPQPGETAHLASPPLEPSEQLRPASLPPMPSEELGPALPPTEPSARQRKRRNRAAHGRRASRRALERAHPQRAPTPGPCLPQQCKPSGLPQRRHNRAAHARRATRRALRRMHPQCAPAPGPRLPQQREPCGLPQRLRNRATTPRGEAINATPPRRRAQHECRRLASRAPRASALRRLSLGPHAGMHAPAI